ncbi:DUF1525 domain-containing protein [Hahella ganghwensis]|uniref:DUF1525 domain-containing protein n=1 Tax=Hahella ganghwensis TaxID=286420 RepID=UPI0003723FBC|nr:DUF1525 domain-containing protein [Hahella ganghwensis]
MPKILICLLLLLTSLFGVAEVLPSSIDFISNDSLKLEPSEIKYWQSKGVQVNEYSLDAPAALERKIGAGFESVPHSVSKEDKDVITHKIKARLKKYEANGELQQVFHGLILAKKYKLTSYPAAVFNNGESVVYGVLDLDRVIQIWQEDLRGDK